MPDLRITNSNVTTARSTLFDIEYRFRQFSPLPEKPESQTTSIYLDRRCMNDPDPSIKKGQVDLV